MIDLEITAATGKQFAPFLRTNLKRAHGFLNPKLRQLSLALVGDRAMSDLHFRFMGINHPTDVLTFPLELNRTRAVLSGEVVVCVPQAIRQAKVRGIPAKHELLLYALHGMLHLCGFDDRTPAGFRSMHRVEDQILTQLGVGRVFALNRGGASAVHPPRPKRVRRGIRRGTPS